MATTTKVNSNPTLADMMDRFDPQGNLADVMEVLTETNEMLDDITWVQANNKFSHRTTVRTGLPKVTWRKLNYGVQPSKSTVAQVTDTCGMLEAFAVVDKKLCEMNGMRESWRSSEERPFVEAMSQTLQRALFFGDSSKDPEQIMGFGPRFSTKDPKKAANGVNIIDAGGTGTDLTSIWLVGWSPNTVHGLFPEGTKAGLYKEDLGEASARDPDGGEYRVLKTHYGWDCGLCVRDWRYVVRIANIKESLLKSVPPDENSATGHNLYELLVKAVAKVPSLSGARFALYCNRTVETYLRLQQANSRNVQLTLNEVGGRKVLSFEGIPFRRVDALEFTEAQVK
ncbi:MAG: major capsid protein [Duodenibacillus sp.]